jgi:hypothetical protein
MLPRSPKSWRPEPTQATVCLSSNLNEVFSYAVKTPLSRRRAPERLPKKGFALFEAKPSLQSPGSIEEHRASRLRRDKGHGCLFFFVLFLWASKEKGQMHETCSPTCQKYLALKI